MRPKHSELGWQRVSILLDEQEKLRLMTIANKLADLHINLNSPVPILKFFAVR